MIAISNSHGAAQHHQDLPGLVRRGQGFAPIQAAQIPAPVALGHQPGQAAWTHQLLVLEHHHLRNLSHGCAAGRSGGERGVAAAAEGLDPLVRHLSVLEQSRRQPAARIHTTLVHQST